MEEGADRHVHRGPAGAAARPQVPQQAPAGRRGALQAAPLPQEQQRPLTPGAGVPARTGPWGSPHRGLQPLKWSLPERDGAEGGSAPVRGSSAAGETPDAEMLLIGVVTFLRPGVTSLPAVPPATVLTSPTRKTTEEEKVFSLLHTLFGTYEPRT